MTIWYKQGVIGRMNPQLRKAVGRIHGYYAQHGLSLYITSVEEGNHSAGSLHYCGDAVDFRRPSEDFPTIEDIRKSCGPGFDVVEYGWGFHVEWDPK
jgi:hypothetical protein